MCITIHEQPGDFYNLCLTIWQTTAWDPSAKYSTEMPPSDRMAASLKPGALLKS
jgi:hypothetical protein